MLKTRPTRSPAIGTFTRINVLSTLVSIDTKLSNITVCSLNKQYTRWALFTIRVSNYLFELFNQCQALEQRMSATYFTAVTSSSYCSDSSLLGRATVSFTQKHLLQINVTPSTQVTSQYAAKAMACVTNTDVFTCSSMHNAGNTRHIAGLTKHFYTETLTGCTASMAGCSTAVDSCRGIWEVKS